MKWEDIIFTLEVRPLAEMPDEVISDKKKRKGYEKWVNLQWNVSVVFTESLTSQN